MKKLSNLKFIAPIFTLSILAGCQSTGIIQGVSEGQNVQFQYEQDFFDQDGALTVTMPDGEHFTGKFVQSTSSRSGSDWEIGESSNDDAYILKDSTTVSSRTTAILIGNRGNTMKCRLEFSNPNIGISGGGIGDCKTSDGRSVTVTF